MRAGVGGGWRRRWREPCASLLCRPAASAPETLGRRPEEARRRPAFPKSAVRLPAIQVQVAGCTVSLLQLEKAVSSKVLDSEHRPRPGGRQKVQAPAHGVGGAPSCVKCRILGAFTVTRFSPVSFTVAGTCRCHDAEGDDGVDRGTEL